MPQPVRKYKDLDLNLAVHPNTNDLIYLKDEQAIKRAVKNIVLTSFYERHFDDMFGCEVKSSLFDNMSPMTIVNIQTSIEDSLRMFEPRVKLLKVEVIAEPDDNAYKATIWFNILNNIQPVVVNLFLERVR